MKRIKSIYLIFMVFVVMIIACLAIIYRYSTSYLKDSLMHAAQLQIDHASSLLNQKIREIEVEADWILNSDDLNELHNIFESEYDPYNYVMGIKDMKEYLKSRQKSNVGMSGFILYWPDSGRTVFTETVDNIDKEMLEKADDNLWITYGNKVYFVRQYITDWDDTDDEPYLIIKMERDYLYRIKNMASGMESGGTFLTCSNGKSLFSFNNEEASQLFDSVRQNTEELNYEVVTEHGKYQILTSEITKNGLKLISCYPIGYKVKPIGNITRITIVSLLVIMLIGLIFMHLYYHNILLQLKIITEKLKQVEQGDFTTQVTVLPDNEFSYVFGQFNRMVTKIRQLMSTIIREQQIRSQAELHQLQLQINPHFLYNSLSYIVTVAQQPQAVIEMAVHLSNYYRYCTLNKSITTIGEEILYAKAYLSIMAMRKSIEYSINVSAELDETLIIPLILQPIIENAIEHAIEKREHAKHISIKIHGLSGGAVRFEISDDGDGMSNDDIKKLESGLMKRQRDEDEGIGLWNVNQRLINYYDESARLVFSKSIWGGLSVSFTIIPGRIGDDSINRG